MKSWKKWLTLRRIKPQKAETYPQNSLTKILDISGDFIFGYYDNCVSYSTFPNAIITPVHKKDAKRFKDNYRTASIHQIFLNFLMFNPLSASVALI